MFVSEILREAEYKVQVSGTGQSKSFNVVNVQTGAEVSRHRNRATANMAKDRLMPKPLSPADRLKKIANTDGMKTDRRVGKDAAKDYLDKKGLDTTTDDSKKGKIPDADKPKGLKKVVAKTKSGIAIILKTMAKNFPASVFFLFIGADQFLKDLQTFAKVYEGGNCKRNTPMMQKAQLEFSDRLTSNIVASCVALAAQGLVIKTIRSILAKLGIMAKVSVVGATNPATAWVTAVIWIKYLILWVGAEAAIYGMVKLLEAKWFHAALSDWFMRNFFTKNQLVQWSVGLGYITADSPCYARSPGFVRKEQDEINEENVFETVTKADVKAGIKDIIVNDPKMLAFMKKAKRNKAKGIKAKVT